MDYVVHINNGSEKAEPIILRLIPGEEMKLDLKVVNHGAPSNISLKASNNIANAVRTDKPDHYLEADGTIPILARMPDVNRLDGEILLTGEGRQSKVPITFIRDSVGPEDNGPEKYAQLSSNRENDEDNDEETYEERDPEDDDSDIEGPKDTEDSEGSEISEGSGDSEDTSRIKFSKEKDLERYRASRKRRSQRDDGDSDYPAINNSETSNSSDYRAMDFEDSVGGRQLEDAPSYGYSVSTEGDETADAAEVDVENSDESKWRIFDLISDKSTLLVVPIAILMALIALLILTFYYESIPEFTGALASSMLIVTLIIYGAATLLKA